MKLDDELNVFLDSLLTIRLSLKTFLVACLRSKDRRIIRKMRYFYSHNGPAEVIELWKDNIHEEDDVQSMLLAATDLLLKHCNVELDEASSDPKLRLPAKSVTSGRANAFKLRAVTRSFEVHAPTITRLITGLANANKNPSRCPTVIVTMICSMLLFLRNRNSNYLQMIMGLYLFSKGAPRQLVGLLSKTGMSVSHQTVLRSLESLTTAAKKDAKKASKTKPWYLVYDNINMAFRKYDQRLDNQDSFESGTAATLVIRECSDEIGYLQGPIQLQVSDLMPSQDNEAHLRSAIRYHLVDLLRRRVKKFETLPQRAMPAPEIKVLPTKATSTIPLPSMHVDQSSIEGNQEVIDIIMTAAMDLPHDWFNGRYILIGGDQLTVARIRSAKALRWDDVSAYHRLEWAMPVMQLFHLQMLLASTILRTHYGSNGAPGSLAAIAGLLGRKRVGLDKPDFHATDELLRHTFDAMALRIWQVELECDNLEHFDINSVGADLNEMLVTTCDRILDKYFTTRNAENLNGTSSKNAASFLRIMVLYLELTSATKAGDTGRIKECIKWLTIIFQSGSTRNYANELLHLHCGLSYTWTEKTKDAITSSWLINTTGQPNRWIPADLHQEHNNLLIKTIHSAKGSNSSWEFLEQSVSTNINTFQSIKNTVEREFEVPHSGTNHTSASSEWDVVRILEIIKENGILDNKPQPVIPRLEGMAAVKDLFAEGLKKLTHEKRIENFLSTPNAFDGHQVEQPLTDTDVDMEDVVLDIGFDIDEYVTATSD
ncbi:hypothetical protein BGZ99_001111 [Dissophora globulifera]|uniref:DUF6589 domain-containing protein n=1 Tax=Dissophora globulifera TaxID=979702 RepID=A0A9P6R3B5_9FUNG|nr:hypothetical protein BGZ99_001111 [Dissophora globulifera]